MYTLQRYVLMTLDPVHIGTGGYRLGRVDNSIVREPGTNLPKVPGTSLSGAIRQYAAYRYENPPCAGQGGHCGESNCPICYTFGSLKTKTQNSKEKQHARAGVVNLFDAHILLFPVHSMAGPVWVSTKSRLKDFGFQVDQPPIKSEECAIVGEWWAQEALNLGWTMLKAAKGAQVTESSNSALTPNEAWKTVKERLVLVSDKLFSAVVNSNLEVRTSVSINPLTGAAKDGALFTYEAIPRTTWLVMDAVVDDYRWEYENGKPKRGSDGKIQRAFPVTEKSKLLGWTAPIKVIAAGLEMIESLGIGGMGTRGFGRVRVIADWTIQAKGGCHGRAET
ncbi:type III-B CRISPR module RAMP protein Cmr4 [Candidatus Bipolaricaulota bacterium]|nr:type III-B CRISPR module RAMP protein Cmr4 [Candidatus Bipolaricaulota bacterium]